jgi:signal transduction histidine kinase
LAHAVLDIPISVAVFVPTVVFLSVGAGLLITFPLALLPIWLLFEWTRIVGRFERHRLAAFHDVELADPIPPYAPGSWWDRFKERLMSRPRWKQIAYSLLCLPIGVAFGTVLLALWSTSLVLLAMPALVHAFPDDVAHFGLFDVGTDAGSYGMGLLGLAGLLVIAPWATVLVGRAEVALARALLSPRPDADLVAQATKAEAGRSAAVEAAEAERRRIERDLHDGAQQRLVALAMDLGAARQRLDSDPETARHLVAEAHEEAKAALREIRDLVRGIHPVILEDRGLDAALSAVVARSAVPVELDVVLPERPPAAVESAGYFVVSEALANVARHAQATRVRVAIVQNGDRLIIEVRDDGIGGADPSAGTGLAGLAERVRGMGGTMDLLSPVGGPTTLLVELPCAS